MFFGYTNVDPANVRNMADIGGGGLYDIGCYAIVAGRWFFEGEPSRGIALIDRDPRSAPTASRARSSSSATAAASTSRCRRRSRRTSASSSAAPRAASSS
jgi:predicted dehydrogenase